jgi:hypothetical protein
MRLREQWSSCAFLRWSDTHMISIERPRHIRGTTGFMRSPRVPERVLHLVCGGAFEQLLHACEDAAGQPRATASALEHSVLSLQHEISGLRRLSGRTTSTHQDSHGLTTRTSRPLNQFGGRRTVSLSYGEKEGSSAKSQVRSTPGAMRSVSCVAGSMGSSHALLRSAPM